MHLSTDSLPSGELGACSGQSWQVADVLAASEVEYFFIGQFMQSSREADAGVVE